MKLAWHREIIWSIDSVAWQSVQFSLSSNPRMQAHLAPTIWVWWMDLYRYCWTRILSTGLVVLHHIDSFVSLGPLKALMACLMESSISDAHGGSSFSIIDRMPQYVVAWLRAASLAPCMLSSSAMSRLRL